MAKPRPTKRTLDSYMIKGSNKIIKPGDCVLMRPPDSSKLPYVARVESIEAGARGSNVKVRVRWYYRPEESIGGRRQFHGAKEVFLSDHYDIQSADTIEGKCFVHSFKNYTKLDAVGSDDYFCRFEYKSATGSFIPDRIAVFCKCEMPYNPDDLMIQCEGCSDWYHPACIDMTVEEAKKVEHFFCQGCSSQNEKKTDNSSASRESESKAEKSEPVIVCRLNPKGSNPKGGEGERHRCTFLIQGIV
ncbi:Chromatin remodeling protein EBS [Cocos nucifera]|uniref:Chromatin remodeling protein EBS n=1 Tax=Cocos nucifera TaxID=13894 RepID=A0A8K0ICR3_COCNU|nr:Chromatin remodeling protein EBS [Cocos nucifera]